MAKVFFKRGHQSVLDTLITQVANETPGKSFVEGSFYLTDDTNRLYFAQSSTNLVDLNQYIHFVQYRNQLPTSASATLKEGDIYYVSDVTENILCIYHNNGWVQINPDTTLTTSNSIISVDEDTSTNSATVAASISDTKSHTASGSFDIVGGSNVHISASGNTITISADNDTTNTTYDIATTYQTQKGQILLDSSAANDDSTIDIVGDGSNIFVTSDANGTITITGNAGVTGISNEFDENGNYQIFVTTTGTDLETTAIQPTIHYGYAQGSQLDAHFDNGTANLSIYTKAEIDTLIQNTKDQLNAMKYAGTVSQSTASTLLVSAPEYGVGTVYKASEDITLSSPTVSAKTGDLIIAGGSNDTAVTWEVVPSGDDQMISIAGSSAEGSVVFHDGITNNNIGVITVAGGRKNSSTANAAIEVSTAVSGTDNSETTFTIVHGTPGAGTAVTATTATSATTLARGTAGGNAGSITVPIITGLSKDAQGHITSITAQEYTFVDSHATLTAQSSTDVENNEATVTHSIALDGTNSQDVGFGITSNNLTITQSNSGTTSGDIVIDLEWGTFS